MTLGQKYPKTIRNLKLKNQMNNQKPNTKKSIQQKFVIIFSLKMQSNQKLIDKERND